MLSKLKLGELKMNLSYKISEAAPEVAVLSVEGRIDASNYLDLIEKARELFAGGTGYLLLNLEGCDFLSSSGLFGLHSIALMAHEFEPPDPETGWGALSDMVNEDRTFKERFKIVNLQPNVLRTLNIAGFSSKFDVYPAMQDALDAFKVT